jgi:diguanylate cyclase (GGDEF)-like protein/PAS domain S-box-containing protein
MAPKNPRSVNQLFKPIIEQVSDIIVITSAGEGPDGKIDPKIVFVNPAFTRMTGYTPHEVIGRSAGFLQGSGTDRAACARIRAALQARQPIRAQLLNYAKNGRPYWLDLNIIPLADETSAITHFAAIERDITAQKAAENALSDLASSDELTGMANRRTFRAELRREVARALRYSQPLALIAVDLDHFKRINDAHGHEVGDAVLIGFSEVARRTLRQIDLIGRIGGEEFDILAPDTNLEDAAHLAERLAHELRHSTFHCRDIEVGITASFGVTALSGPDDSADAMLRRSDQAMYSAKLAGRDRVHISDANPPQIEPLPA